MRVRLASGVSTLSAGAACLASLMAFPCKAEPSPAAVVWYRSAEGCPDAAEFLSRLGDLASLARVAEAGDYIDFVVTLVSTEQGSSGRLERQTQSGTVAIQEIRDKQCARVADALALSLALALDPEAPLARRAQAGGGATPSSGVSGVPSGEAPQGHHDDAAERTVALAWPSERSTGSRAGGHANHASAEPGERTRKPEPRVWAWFVGAHGGLGTGVTPEAAVRGDVFAEMGWALPEGVARDGAARGRRTNTGGPDALDGATVRLAAVAATSSPEQRSVGTVRHSVIAGRADACWPDVAGTWVALRPCLAIELGAATAAGSRRTGVRDAAFWVALGAGGRGRAWVTRVVGLEAEVGLLVPLRRYVIQSDAGTLYDNRQVGFSAALGPVLRLY